jgi:hypothetical protein
MEGCKTTYDEAMKQREAQNAGPIPEGYFSKIKLQTGWFGTKKVVEQKK